MTVILRFDLMEEAHVLPKLGETERQRAIAYLTGEPCPPHALARAGSEIAGAWAQLWTDRANEGGTVGFRLDDLEVPAEWELYPDGSVLHPEVPLGLDGPFELRFEWLRRNRSSDDIASYHGDLVAIEPSECAKIATYWRSAIDDPLLSPGPLALATAAVFAHRDKSLEWKAQRSRVRAREGLDDRLRHLKEVLAGWSERSVDVAARQIASPDDLLALGLVPTTDLDEPPPEER